MNSMIARLMSVVLVAGVSGVLLTEISDTSLLRDTSSRRPDQSALGKTALSEPIEFARPENATGWTSLEEMHAAYVEAFVNSQGFGMERILTFETPSKRSLFVNGRPFRVKRMELVSLMPEQPIAYQSTFVNATREQLDIHNQRPLTEFEEVAMSRVMDGESFVWKEPDLSDTPQSVQDFAQLAVVAELNDEHQRQGTLVAELRATQSCVACH